MSHFVYDGDVRRALAENAAGARVLCPRCGAEIVIAPDIKSGRRYQVHPGIYCSADSKHVFAMFHVAEAGGLLDRVMKKVHTPKKPGEGIE